MRARLIRAFGRFASPGQRIVMTLAEIEAEVERLAARVGASGYILPTYGRSEDGARPHIEADGRGYHYVVVERGQELERITTNDLDELLFHVFESVTFSLASKYELAHRIERQDFRRILFRRQIELLSVLDPRWGERAARGHEQTLRQHPFDDNASIRASLTKDYRDRGYAPEAAWRMACEKYPLPRA
jgi:Immunity protein 63